jgi:hypothetical protein
MSRLTPQELQEVQRFLAEDKPLPEKYRFLLFEDKREEKLVFNGKSNNNSNLEINVNNIFEKLCDWAALPYYVLETRVDIFLAYFLPKIINKLNSEAKITDDSIFPQFILQKKDKSRKIVDFVAFGDKVTYIIEFKTSNESRNKKQSEFLRDPKLLRGNWKEDLLSLCENRVKNSVHKDKYENLKEKLEKLDKKEADNIEVWVIQPVKDNNCDELLKNNSCDEAVKDNNNARKLKIITFDSIIEIIGDLPDPLAVPFKRMLEVIVGNQHPRCKYCYTRLKHVSPMKSGRYWLCQKDECKKRYFDVDGKPGDEF